MLEQKLESLGKTDYDMAVEMGVRYGKIGMLILAADLALTLMMMSLLSLMEKLDISYSMVHDITSFLNLGEMLAALVFLAMVAIFLASGIMAIKRTPGSITVVQAICISTVSGLIMGAMASIVLVVSMVVIALFAMPQTGYITMFMKFSPDSIFDILKWVPVIAMLAIAAGISYGGMTRKLKKLY